MKKKNKADLLNRIENREAKIAVIGLGYVGLPLAIEFAKAGFKVFGIDVSKEKVRELEGGRSYILDVPSEDVRAYSRKKLFKATTDFSVLKEVDAVSICVPTPLAKTKDPDLSYILSAVRQVQKYLHSEQLVVLESTTYPGTTDEVILPILEKTGLKLGKDFFLAFSPERVDPSNPKYKTKNIPKVVGGMTANCIKLAAALYSATVDTVVEVSSPKTAEMVKLVENTFRSVNIGLMNELCLMCGKLGIDIWEVIEAAKTKPFGFMPFYPGPGLGGHCIPIDPFYLSWKARIHGFEPRFIELAGEINQSMPEHVVTRIQDLLNKHGKTLKGARVLVLGVAYKKDIDDLRESPALDVMDLLFDKNAEVIYSDPHIPHIKWKNHYLKSVLLVPVVLKKADLVVILTDHKAFDYSEIVRNAALIFDTRNALRGIKACHVERL
ncbi:MAG: nucleotide sugar dehydrogenase [Patescibacteria group bacterium]|jgi:UDP-N-acetyl-D-glucosamine dehydrogenase